MSHFVTVTGITARCVCGYSATATTPQAVEDWRRMHYAEMGVAMGPLDTPIATTGPAEPRTSDPNKVRAEKCARGEHCRDHSDGKCCGCESKHGIELFTDDQLRAECERRAFPVDASDFAYRLMGRSASHCFHGQKREDGCVMCRIVCAAATDRDDWKATADQCERDADEYREKWSAMAKDRDEWKRTAELATPALKALRERAEAAEARVATLEARINEGYLPTIARYMRLNESGPGIGSHPPDIHKPDPNNAHYVDPLDLLCEDA